MFNVLIVGHCHINKGQMMKTFSDSFTILGLSVLGLAVSYINGSNCKRTSDSFLFNLPKF